MTILHNRLGGDFASPGVVPSYAPDLGLEPVDLDLSVRLDFDSRAVEGDATYTLVVRDAGATLTLNAVDFASVDVIEPDGHDIEWHYDGEHIEVQWTTAPEAGDRRRVTIRWWVVDPLCGMTFHSEPRWAATDHETERARYWLPCIDHPNVRTSLAIAIRADAELTALANGALVSEEDHDDGSKTTRWALDFPCPAYLLCLAVGEFVRADGGDADGVVCASFAPPPYTVEDLARSFDPTADMLRWMTAKLDSAFPFPKYFQFAVPGIGGAMENISLVSWDDRFVLDERARAELGSVVDRINLHEMAHSWFGDALVCRDFSHVWLKESWATYMETVWTEDTLGTDEFQWLIREKSQAYRGEADSRYVRPIITRDFDSSWDMFDQHLYPGGACRLHMLRKELGDDVFWTGVRAYVATYTGQVVETADFRRTMEEVSGRSLARFFDQWFRRKGYPKLKATFSFDRKASEAVIKVEQTQVSKDGGVGLFAMDLTVAVEIDGEWQQHRLHLQDERSMLVVRTRKRPTAIVFDPDADALFSLEWKPGAELLGHALKTAPTVAGRVQAAEALGRLGRRGAVSALVEAYPSEPFWGVRVAIARALARSDASRAASALATLLPDEHEPRCQSALATACGRMRHPDLAQALRTWLDVPRPYAATGAALRALAKQQHEEDLDRFREFAADDGWWGWLRQGALQALAATRDERALVTVIEGLDVATVPLQVRGVAAMAAGDLGRWLDPPAQARALNALEDVAHDPIYRVRRMAVRGLRSLGTAGAPEAMHVLTQTLAEQDRPAARRETDEVRRRRREGGRVPELTRQVEGLRERLRKTEKRVEDLEARKGRRKR
jgi:aminopeptidase N